MTIGTTAPAPPWPRAGGGMRFSVDAWDPSYGTSVAEDGLREATTPANADVEVPAADWQPVALPGERGLSVTPPSAVLFVDGVRRVEARAWIHDVAPDGSASSAAPAICASYAGGVVCCCPAGAHLLAAQVRRGLFTSARHARDVRTREGVYQVHHCAGSSPEALSLAVQRELSGLEITTAVRARQELPAHHPASDGSANPAGPADDALLVVDGPLRSGAHPRTVGFVKTHHSSYLDGP
ncbi:MAG: hypothetical protein IRZ08_13840, partial [Frankia sp.]|nr:hypothetical protein [Frankia sp.]